MLKYVFGLIFIVLAWAAVFVFDPEVPVELGIIVTALVVLGLPLWLLLRFLLARRAAGRIENALARGAAGADEGLRPEARAQIDEMRAEFDKALRTLKGSKLGKHGSSALAALPWYVIIGPPGSGKSTLLRNSGLRFPYLSAKRGAVRGVGGTRNCDWWLANEGILLDTAGRWATEDDDQEEWLAFLDLLKRTRRGQALNGVLVAITAKDLLGESPDDVPNLAKKLRERVDEVMGRLELHLPVYLLVTKCDLVGGFVETFERLGEKERGQIWGLTLPLEAPPGARPELFVERLDRLVDVVEQQSLVRLRADARPEVARRLYEFPQQFEELCPGLVDLVNDLFAENAYQDAPILRGVYFTSATQEGRPIDRVVQRMAAAIGIAPVIDAAPVLKAKSYFLRDVFRNVIFPDQNVATSGEKALRRRRLVEIAIAAGTIAASVGIALMPVSAYSRNLMFARRVSAWASALVESHRAGGNLPVPGPALDGAFETSAELQREDVPLGMRFGFYQGGKLYPVVARVARNEVVRPLLTGDASRLGAFTSSKAAEADDVAAALRLGLLGTMPKSDNEPRPGQGAWAEAVQEARALGAARWRRQLEGRRLGASSRGEAVVADAIELYLRQAPAQKDLWEPRDNVVVARARKGLCELAQKDPIDRIVASEIFAREDVTLRAVMGGAFTLFQEDAKVPGGFTRAGWPVVKERLLSKTGSGEDSDLDWALDRCEAFDDKDLEKHRGEYVRRYIERWMAFIARVLPVRPRDLADANEILRRHVEQKPLASLWQSLAANIPVAPPTTAAPGEPPSVKDRVIKSWQKTKKRVGLDHGPDPEVRDLGLVEQRFRPFIAFGVAGKPGTPTSLELYEGKLQLVADALAKYADTREVVELRQAVSGAKREVDALISRSGARDFIPELRRLLLAPLDDVEALVGGEDARDLNRRWCDAVVARFGEVLGESYPFNRNGPDAPLDAIEKFFHPQSGALWMHVKGMERHLEPDSFRPRAGTGVPYREALTSYLKRARAATELLFRGTGGQLGIPVEARLWPGGREITQVTLRLGNTRLVHRNEPEQFRPLPWPGRDAELVVYGPIELRPAMPGDWALFRLLDQAKKTQARDREAFLRAQFQHPTANFWVHIDFKPANLVSALEDLVPPRAVTSAPSPCGG